MDIMDGLSMEMEVDDSHDLSLVLNRRPRYKSYLILFKIRSLFVQ